MPWTIRDVDRFRKGLTPRQKRQWVAVANSVYERCIANGGSDAVCAARAIRMANGTVKEKESAVAATTLEATAARLLRNGVPSGLEDDLYVTWCRLKNARGVISVPLTTASVPDHHDDSGQVQWSSLQQSMEHLLHDGGYLDFDERKALYEHLAEHYRDLGKDPPDFAAEVAKSLIAEAEAILPQEDSWSSRQFEITIALRKQCLLEHGDLNLADDEWPLVIDFFDDAVVYQYRGGLWRRDYTLTPEGMYQFSEPMAVKVAYVPSTDSLPTQETAAELISIDSDLAKPTVVLAKEADSNSTIRVKLIAPGWGSSGYYSKELLQTFGPKTFPAGTLMFWNHPTPLEEKQRPEGSLYDLAGVTVTDARYEDDSVHGPGLYAQAKVFSPFREVLKEMAPHIGASIRVWGRYVTGEAEGKQGRLFTEFVGRAESVDFVTRPGAGGKVIEAFESAAGTTTNEEVTMTEEMRKAIESAQLEVRRLREALALQQAQDLAVKLLRQYGLPEATQRRLAEECVRKTPVNDTGLDREAFESIVREAATKEIEYLKELGVTSGRVVGLGPASLEGAGSEEAASKLLAESFKRLGWSDRAAQIAAAGRNNG